MSTSKIKNNKNEFELSELIKFINQYKMKSYKMKSYKIIQRLQNSPLTRWIWNDWQYEDTGYISLLPFWKKPEKRWYKVKYKN